VIECPNNILSVKCIVLSQRKHHRRLIVGQFWLNYAGVWRFFDSIWFCLVHSSSDCRL